MNFSKSAIGALIILAAGLAFLNIQALVETPARGELVDNRPSMVQLTALADNSREVVYMLDKSSGELNVYYYDMNAKAIQNLAHANLKTEFAAINQQQAKQAAPAPGRRPMGK